MVRSERHEILFCHDLLQLLQYKYPDAEFFDDFKGQSRSEFYFCNRDDVFIVEAKSDIEAKTTPWKGKKFQSTRDAIRWVFPNRADSKYARWTIYLAQLYDYANRFDKFTSFNTMLGLPFDRLEDAIQGITTLQDALRINSIDLTLNYECERCEGLNVAYLHMSKIDLTNLLRTKGGRS